MGRRDRPREYSEAVRIRRGRLNLRVMPREGGASSKHRGFDGARPGHADNLVFTGSSAFADDGSKKTVTSPAMTKSENNLSLAVIGAGMGGLAVAATLRQAGFAVQVYEQ